MIGKRLIRQKILLALTLLFLMCNWSNSQWRFKPPTPVHSNAAAGIAGKMYAFGGDVSPTMIVFNGCEEYDTLTNAWRSRSPMLSRRHSLGGVAVNGRAYAIGGHYGNSVASNEEFNPASNSWTAKTQMQLARSSFGIAALGDTVYTIGGNASGTISSIVHAFVVSSNSWITSIPSLPAARYENMGAAVNGKVYTIGGRLNSGQLDGRVYQYSPGSPWTEKPQQPTPTAASGVCVVEGKIYIIGGNAAFGDTRRVQIYDPANNSWAYGDSLVLPRSNHNAIAFGNAIYVSGGLSSSGKTGMEVLQAPSTAGCIVPERLTCLINPYNIEYGGSGSLWAAYETHATGNVRYNLSTCTRHDSMSRNIGSTCATNNGRGVAWDGRYLWIAEWSCDSLYRIDPANGNVVRRFRSPGNKPQALAYGAGYLWHTDEDSTVIFKIDTLNGQVIARFPLPANNGWFRGIAYAIIGTSQYLITKPANNDSLFVQSTQNGQVLRRLCVNLGGVSPGDITCDSGYVYMNTGGNLYRISLPPVSVDEGDRVQVNSFILSQNYPNPFNPSTTIEYDLPQRSQVEIKIFNSLGQLVRTLVKSQSDAGRHSIIWNGQSDEGNVAATGVYFYQLRAGNFVQTKKLILMR